MRKAARFVRYQLEEVLCLLAELISFGVRSYDAAVPYVRTFGPVVLSYVLALAAAYLAVTL